MTLLHQTKQNDVVPFITKLFVRLCNFLLYISACRINGTPISALTVEYLLSLVVRDSLSPRVATQAQLQNSLTFH